MRSCFRLARAAGLGRFAALLVFLTVVSLRHYENLLIGFQFGLILSVLAGSVAVWLAGETSGPRNVALATLLAVISAASSAGGLIALGLVLAIGVVDWKVPKRALLAIAVVGLVVVLAAIALYSVESIREQYFARMARSLQGKSVAQVLFDWVRVMAGGLVPDKASTAAGLMITAGVVGGLAGDVRRNRRISGFAALALFALLSTLVIAWGRSPVTEVASRWGIYAAPAIAVGLIWLVRGLSAWTRDRSMVAINVTLASVMIWLAAANAIDAGAYAKHIDAWQADNRASLIYLKAGLAVSDADIARVNPGPPDFIRQLMTFFNEHGPQAGERETGLAVLNVMPTDVARQASISRDGDLVLLRGPGYTYRRMTCDHESGCLVRLSVDVSAEGRATTGIIVYNPDGSARVNNYQDIPTPGFSVKTVSAAVAFREKFDPYVFCYTDHDTARIREFKVFNLPATQTLR